MVPVEFERIVQDEGQTMNDPSKARAGHAWIRERIAHVPRVRLALTPTPLHAAPNLTRMLGGPHIFIKRDDLRRRPKTSESRQVAGVFGWVREIPARA
jgi:hypothetical protein